MPFPAKHSSSYVVMLDGKVVGRVVKDEAQDFVDKLRYLKATEKEKVRHFIFILHKNVKVEGKFFCSIVTQCILFCFFLKIAKYDRKFFSRRFCAHLMYKAIMDGSLQNRILDFMDGSIQNQILDSMDGSLQNQILDSMDGSIQNQILDSMDGSIQNRILDSMDGPIQNQILDSMDGSIQNQILDSMDGPIQNQILESMDGSIQNRILDSMDGSI